MQECLYLRVAVGTPVHSGFAAQVLLKVKGCFPNTQHSLGSCILHACTDWDVCVCMCSLWITWMLCMCIFIVSPRCRLFLVCMCNLHLQHGGGCVAASQYVHLVCAVCSGASVGCVFCVCSLLRGVSVLCCFSAVCSAWLCLA